MSASVVSVRRYPVKAMGGESPAVVQLDARGVTGDRWFAVVDDEGRLASGKNTRRMRRHDEIFGYRAATRADGRVTVSGRGGTWPVGSPELDEELTRSFRTPVRVAAEASIAHQDAGAISLVGTATLAWCAHRFGGSPDARRLRVNFVLETSEPFEEESWIGQVLDAGTARLRVVRRIERCRTIDLDQDDATAGAGWLKPLGEERDLSVAVYADVVMPGRVSPGDAYRLGPVAGT
ncbi:MOSC domain-containing protein [Microbacterium sp. I2]|uniref:MOSC domain-containing protein n=1 Tax=Microbacterium sp. I2 TaxID=3391826 RepID=UPI003EDAA74E